MNKKKCMILALAVLPMLNSCSDWLDRSPFLSIHLKIHMWMLLDFMQL